LQLRGRLVIGLENVPAANVARILNKIERELQLDDPTPDIRAQQKNDLPWNRTTTGTDSTRTLRVDLPATWTQLPDPPDPRIAAGFDDKVVLVARRGAAALCVAIDPEAHDPLGASGFAHSVARRLQSQGHGVYIRRDQDSDRLGGAYEHVFLQHEGTPGDEHDAVYSIAVVPLAQGFGLIILREPGAAASQATDFNAILDGVRLIQEDANPKLASEPLTPAARRSN
jgi:hypothetical protein